MSKDYERLCKTSEAMIYALMSRLMVEKTRLCLTLLAQLLVMSEFHAKGCFNRCAQQRVVPDPLLGELDV